MCLIDHTHPAAELFDDTVVQVVWPITGPNLTSGIGQVNETRDLATNPRGSFLLGGDTGKIGRGERI
jgi:hypothetical protein